MALNLYSIDIRVCATLYIKAESEEEARRLANEQAGLGILVPDDTMNQESGPDFSGEDFDSTRLPTISLSPAMTLNGPYKHVDLKAENVPAYEEEA